MTWIDLMMSSWMSKIVADKDGAVNRSINVAALHDSTNEGL